jgi:ribosomal RNA-processing protein 7
MKMTVSSATLIKGYLPVRLTIEGKQTVKHKPDETFFFVREHQTSKRNDDNSLDQGSNNNKNSNSKTGCTLFVANVPIVPGIATDVVLKSIFGRFGDINRVTAIENPRKDAAAVEGGASSSSSTNDKNEIPSSWTFVTKDPTFSPHISGVGKFAHVVYKSPKDMRKALRALEETMIPSKKKKNHSTGLQLENIEIQTLSDESHRRYLQQEKEKRKAADPNWEDADSDSDGSNFDLERTNGKQQQKHHSKGILRVAARFRSSCNAISREALLEECNTVMQAYEFAETESKKAHEAAKSQPDEDGFVTVTNADAGGRTMELEEGASGTIGRKRNKRSRKKKKEGASGAEELQDFYRFQRREGRKRSLEMLRKQFEDDLSKVKKMKSENHYRPFG